MKLTPSQNFRESILKLRHLLTKEEEQVILRVRLMYVEYCYEIGYDTRYDVDWLESPMFLDYYRDQIHWHEAIEQYEVCAILMSIADKLKLDIER